MRNLTIYLAGAIRDGVDRDIEWREDVIMALRDLPVTILNPFGGTTFETETMRQVASGVLKTPKFIVRHDFWAVDRSDIVLFNFQALAEGYPNIGTLVEFGRATSTGALIYSVIAGDYKGHENKGHFKGLHPFLAENSAVVFNVMDDCVDFLRRHVMVLSGAEPSYVPGKEG